MPEIPWFSEDLFDRPISFSELKPFTWILKHKISESAFQDDQELANESGTPSEARATFLCSRADGNAEEEAVIKIGMQ